jgi:hypothetical protein
MDRVDTFLFFVSDNCPVLNIDEADVKIDEKKGLKFNHLCFLVYYCVGDFLNKNVYNEVYDIDLSKDLWTLITQNYIDSENISDVIPLIGTRISSFSLLPSQDSCIYIYIFIFFFFYL